MASNLNSLLEEAMNELNDKNWKLESVACCLSGGGTKLAQSLLLDEFKKLNVGYSVHVANDSLAAIFTAFKNGKNFHRSQSIIRIEFIIAFLHQKSRSKVNNIKNFYSKVIYRIFTPNYSEIINHNNLFLILLFFNIYL